VPNKVEPAQKLIKSLKAFLGWQSTVAFLKEPPQSYMFPPVDILGGLDNISAIAGSGGFKNEFDFGLAIVYLIQAGHDGHFAFRPDVFRGFGFRNRMAMDIVSVSIDGLQVPKLYHFCKSDLVGSLKSCAFLTRCSGVECDHDRTQWNRSNAPGHRQNQWRGRSYGD